MIKRLGVFSVLLLLAAILCSGCGGGIGSDFHGFEDVTIDELYDAYYANKLAAKDTYQGKYVRVSGILSYIDDSGTYFRIDDGSFLTSRVIKCNIATSDVRSSIAKMTKGDRIVVKGKIVDISDTLFFTEYCVDAHYAELDQTSESENASEQGLATVNEDTETQSGKSDASSNTIILKANVPGEYGQDFTLYGGGSEDDTATRLGWFVPEGTYCVRNLDESSAWEQVNYGLPAPTVNGDGFNESTQFECILVKPDETAVIHIPEGGCIYITGNNGRLELTRQ